MTFLTCPIPSPFLQPCVKLENQKPCVHGENQKYLMAPEEDRTGEIKEDLNKWTGLPCSPIAKFSIVKMSINPKLTFRVNSVLLKIPADFWQKSTNWFWKAKDLKWKKKPHFWKRRTKLKILSVIKTYYQVQQSEQCDTYWSME